MADTYIVVPIADAQRVREALGRLYADSIGSPYPIPSTPPIPGCETLYYADPKESADGDEAAFGPVDDFLTSTLGKSTQLGDGSTVTIPSEAEEVDDDFFPPPPTPTANEE